MPSRMSPFAALVILSLSGFSVAQAQSLEYDFGDTNWNGLSRLGELASEQGIVFDTPLEVDLSTLGPTDSLLILYPQGDLPSRALTDFLRAGGRVAVADDFGQSEEFLSVFSIRRAPPPEEARRFRGNPALLIAQPILRHPLTEGVGHLVTNHAQVVTHQDLVALFGFTGEGRGPVLTGAVGQGRLVVLGDPSVLINNMLEFHGNAQFATNLLNYLKSTDGRFLVVTPRTRIVGGSVGSRKDAVARVNEWLEEVTSARLPPAALIAVAMTFLALALLMIMSALPLRSPYGTSVLPQGTAGSGYAARVRYTLEKGLHRAHACLTYRFEFHAALREQLDLPAGATLPQLQQNAARAGLAAKEQEELGELLRRLESIARQVDVPPGTPNVSTQELRRMVETGERLLARLSPTETSS